MKTRTFCFFAFFVLAATIIGCADSTQEKKLPPDPKFVDFYADLLLVSNDSSAVSRDTVLFKQRIDSVYSVYGYDSAKVNTMVTDYTQTPERWQEFYTLVIAKLKAKGGKSIPDAMQ